MNGGSMHFWAVNCKPVNPQLKNYPCRDLLLSKLSALYDGW